MSEIVGPRERKPKIQELYDKCECGLIQRAFAMQVTKRTKRSASKIILVFFCENCGCGWETETFPKVGAMGEAGKIHFLNDSGEIEDSVIT